MSRYCIDTSAYSHFKLGDSEVVDLIDSAEWIGVPGIVLGELWTGFIQGQRLKANESELREFLANPVVELLTVDRDVARIYGEVVADLRKAGTPIPTNDVWIAAVAARAGATVLTYDIHFRSVSRVGSLVLPA
ncbi:MAG: type II toxin-antitoxin system VapC family toxin [Acidobacteria bacterium]|nr:type II toxin-antitoxin system VapC family toxin [Acidobacteriota bacterium]